MKEESKSNYIIVGIVAIVAIIGMASILNNGKSTADTIIIAPESVNPVDLTGHGSFSCFLDEVRNGNSNMTDIQCICGYGC